MTDYKKFVRERITELRMKKGLSEYQLSLDLGQNKNYIQGITSGKAMPSMDVLFAICDYFEITPMGFFDADNQYPQLIRKAMDSMKPLSDGDMLLLLNIINRFVQEKS